MNKVFKMQFHFSSSHLDFCDFVRKNV